MLEPSLELARRLEAADVRLGLSLVRACQALFPREFSTHCELGGGALHALGGCAPLARVLGMGLDGVVHEQDLERLLDLLDQHRLPAEVQVSSFAEASLLPRLLARGFVQTGIEVVLAREVTAADRGWGAPHIFSIHGMRPGESELWARSVATGFASADPANGMKVGFDPGVLDPLLAIAASDGFLGFLVRLGPPVVAAAGMCCFGDVACLVDHVTSPRMRRRGVQRALIAHSLAIAAERGIPLAKLNALEDSTTLRNALHAGFARVDQRAVLRRPAVLKA